MLVRNWMTKNVITAGPDESMQDVINRSQEKKVKVFPVLEKGKIVGIVTDNDLNRASPSKVNILSLHELLYLASKIKVRDFMTKEVHSIPDNNTIEEAVWLMMGKNISSLPVVNEQGSLVGIITKHDIFRAFAMFSGVGHNKGVELAVRAEQSIGKFKEVRDILTAHGARLGSLLSSVQNAPEGLFNMYVRFAIDRSQLPILEQELAKGFTILYIVDYENNERRVYEACNDNVPC